MYLDVGGRYHTIHVALRECSEVVLDDLLVRDDTEAFDLTSAPPLSLEFSFSRFSVTGAELPKSREVPGVFGVFADDPNDANAPEPRPNADEAPFVGDATLVVVKGVMPLNGLDLLLTEPSLLNRFAGWYGREESDLVLSLLGLAVERDSLLELLNID